MRARSSVRRGDDDEECAQARKDDRVDISRSARDSLDTSRRVRCRPDGTKLGMAWAQERRDARRCAQ